MNGLCIGGDFSDQHASGKSLAFSRFIRHASLQDKNGRVTITRVHLLIGKTGLCYREPGLSSLDSCSKTECISAACDKFGLSALIALQL